MKNSRIALAAAVACMIAGTASAQDLKTGYFLDHYLYGYRLNPAIQVDSTTNTFVGLLVNDMTLGVNSDLGLSNLLFPVNGSLVTGFNDAVSASEFIGGLKITNKMNIDVNENLFAFGHRTKSGLGFWTVEANLRSTSSASAPMSMFEYLKVGSSDNNYFMRNMNVASKNYGELVIGYSRKIGRKVTVGAAVKGIAGLGYARMSISYLNINTRPNPAVANGEGSFVAAFPMYEFSQNEEGYIGLGDLNTSKIGLNGLGAAIDLGITYEVINGLTLSAAVMDVGAIAWKKSAVGTMGTYKFNILENESLSDNIEDMLRFRMESSDGFELDRLNYQVTFGGKYVVPSVEKLTLGAIYSFRLGDRISKLIEFRTGATYTPSHVLSISGSTGVNNYGGLLGAAMNLNLGPLNLFGGIDGIFLKVSPQFIPVKPLSSVAKAGLSLRF